MALIGVLALSACSADQSANTESPTSTAEVIVSSAEPARDWGYVENYDLVFSIQNMNGMGGGSDDGEYAFEVRDGAVVDCSVTSLCGGEAHQGICGAIESPLDHFLSWANRFEPRHTPIEYDPASGLPSRIFYDDPGGVDEEHEIRLIRFEELP